VTNLYPQAYPNPRNPYIKKWWFWVIIVIVLVAIGKNTEEKKQTTSPAEQSTQEQQAVTSAEETTPSQTTPSETTYGIGDVVKFDDSKWIVVAAKDNGSILKSNNMFQKEASTDGKFITVRFKVKNLTKTEDRIMDTPKLIDSQGREFKEYDSQSFYIPEGAKTLTLEALPPSMYKEFYAVYEVPSDAVGFRFQARALSAFGDKILVNLGF